MRLAYGAVDGMASKLITYSVIYSMGDKYICQRLSDRFRMMPTTGRTIDASSRGLD